MIRLVLIACTMMVLLGCGSGAGAPPQTTYVPVPPEHVPTFPLGSRSVVVEFVTADGYGLGSDPPGRPTWQSHPDRRCVYRLLRWHRQVSPE